MRRKGQKNKRVTQKDLHGLSIEVIQETMLLVIDKINAQDLSSTEYLNLGNLLEKMEDVLYGYTRAKIHRQNLKRAREKFKGTR